MIAKIVIIPGAFFVIWSHMAENHKLVTRHLSDLPENLGVFAFWALIVLVFSLANWYFEAKKWQQLAGTLKKTSLYAAFEQSTASLTASLLTPNRIGEYGAKSMYFEKPLRKKVLGLNFIGNSFQLLATISFGIPAIRVLGDLAGIRFSLPLLSATLIATIAIFIFLKRTGYIRRFRDFMIALPNKTLQRTALFSVIRYLIFSHQFYLLLLLSGIDPGYVTGMSLIAATYLITSAIPGFLIFDFVVKGSVAVSLFGMFGVDEIAVLSVTTLMWLLNFALPALIGSYFVLKFEPPETLKIPVKTS